VYSIQVPINVTSTVLDQPVCRSVLQRKPQSEVHVSRHDGDPLAVDGAKIRVLEDLHDECFGSFLQCLYCVGLPAKDLAPKRLVEGYFSDDSGKSGEGD